MGGDPMPHLNHSSPVVDPSIYGYGGQKRSLDEGGEYRNGPVDVLMVPFGPYRRIPHDHKTPL